MCFTTCDSYLVSLLLLAVVNARISDEARNTCFQDRRVAFSYASAIKGVQSSTSCPENLVIESATFLSGDEERYFVRRFQCDDDYTTIGMDSVVCYNGTWNKLGYCKTKNAGTAYSFETDEGPFVDNGRLQWIRGRQGVLRVVCDEGYQLEGNVNLGYVVSDRNGQWSSPGTCSEVASIKKSEDTATLRRSLFGIGSVRGAAITSRTTTVRTTRSRTTPTTTTRTTTKARTTTTTASPTTTRRSIGGMCTPDVVSSCKRVAKLSKKLDSALLNATTKGDYGFVAQLLNQGANPDARDSNGSPVLHLAVSSRSADAVYELTKRCARLNATNTAGTTAVMLASKNNLTSDVLECLLRMGADARLLNIYGSTGLTFAAQNGATKNVESLLKFDADLSQSDNDGNSPLMWAVRGNFSDTVRMILSWCPAKIDDRNAQGLTPLMFAAKGGFYDVVKQLVEQGASLSARDGDGATVINLAIEYGQTDIADWLAKYADNRSPAIVYQSQEEEPDQSASDQSLSPPQYGNYQ